MKSVILLFLYFVYSFALLNDGSVEPCDSLFLRVDCGSDMVCGAFDLQKTTELYSAIPLNAGTVQNITAPTALLTFTIFGIYGTYSATAGPLGATEVHLFVDGSQAGVAITTSVSYGFGPVNIDRTEISTPFLTDGNVGVYEDTNIILAGTSLAALPAAAPFAQFINGRVIVQVWATYPANGNGSVAGDKRSFIKLPYIGTYRAARPLNGTHCDASITSTPSTNKIAFVLETVQDFFLGAGNNAVLSTFQTFGNNLPITVGVVANAFGTDATLRTTLQAAAFDPFWDVEIACEGYNYVALGGLTQSVIQTALSNCTTKFATLFPNAPVTVIPPLASIGPYLIRAAQLTGYTHLFTSVAAETAPFALNSSLFYRFPWVASTYDPATGLGVPAATTFANIQTSLQSFGFATVSMTGNEFTSGTLANTNQVTELQNLIGMINQNGYTVTTVQRINLDSAARLVAPIGNSTCNCLAFRLDNIQDSFLAPAQKAIISLLQSKGVPLTVGVIANAFGNLVANPLDPNNIVPPLQNALQNASTSQCFSLEVGFNGWVYEDFSVIDQPTQQNLLTMGITKIFGTLNVRPTVFLPPFDLYTTLTLQALNATGFDHMSSQTSLDPGPFSYSNRVDGIYRFPIAASTSAYLSGTYYSPVPALTTYNQVVNQVNIYGWGAILMHPQEFTNIGPNGTYTATVNTTQLAQLSNLIDMLRTAGYRFTTIGKIQNYFGNLARDPCLNLFPVNSFTTAAVPTGANTTPKTGATFPTLNAAPVANISFLLPLLFVAMMFLL